ncbi:hypothetical protein BofuT4_P101400.1 [Botrytis cinerea T4]|uniref:Uncharacterized protein n=1 Tax=Botryotinia fuckeliana (strain T4) TaxID=999810 RepID=G2YBZ5_BOTF4|nr:hypothetical protein BofuT4_P101400.1 [Botrytis cinerea T4]
MIAFPPFTTVFRLGFFFIFYFWDFCWILSNLILMDTRLTRLVFESTYDITSINRYYY